MAAKKPPKPPALEPAPKKGMKFRVEVRYLEHENEGYHTWSYHQDSRTRANADKVASQMRGYFGGKMETRVIEIPEVAALPKSKSPSRRRHEEPVRVVTPAPKRKLPHPLPEVTPDVDRYDEAIHAFERRLPMARVEWDALEARERKYAFMVSEVSHADLLLDVYDAIERAIRDGTDLETFKESVQESLFEEWGAEDASRVECLTGETLVSGAVVRAVHRRWFEGNVCDLRTKSGRHFTATANHPMLTRRGWVGAGALNDRDDLVGYCGQEDPRARRDLDVDHPPATIAEVFESARSLRQAERIRSVDLDFHGDGMDGHVDVVRPCWPLTVGDFTEIRQPIGESIFTGTASPGSRFCYACGHLVLISKRCGVCDRPVGYAGRLKALADRAVARVEFFGERIRAFAAQVARCQFVHGDVLSLPRGLTAAGEEIQACRTKTSGSYAAGAKRAGDPSRRDSERAGDSTNALASGVEFDRVQAVSVRPFRGHLFNLSTTSGYFQADGIYTGNTIFRTNVQSAYNEGRYEVFSAPAVKEVRPFFRFDAIDDDRVDDECLDLNGTILEQDDGFWDDNTPPLHFNCRCQITGVTQDEADDAGGADEAPDSDHADDGFGDRPDEEGSDWEPDLDKYPDDIREELEARLKL